ncbi:MAG: hypothetical protein GC159_14350 [Phycisphaera sp.]|nr:hypothetical protein [Phycisphaera sp.]
MKLSTFVLAALACTVVMTGCGENKSISDVFKFKGSQSRPTGEAPKPGEWPFRPIAMRVHPFTSLTIDETTGQAVLEVRIELLDQLGDVAKGVGDFRFELYQSEMTASRVGQETQLQVWEAPMSTLEQNRMHWDAITRTYSFRLHVTHPPMGDKKYKLTVQFNDADGNRLRAEAPTPISRSSSESN